MERGLDGSIFQTTNQFTGNCPLRKKIYSTMAKGIAKLAEEAFFLARSKNNFAIWNLTVSKYADWVIRLGMIKTSWIWEDRLVKGEIPSVGVVMDCVQRGQLEIQGMVSLETFLKAHSLHHHDPSASHPSTTLSVSSPDPKPISNATQLTSTLPAHHPHPSQTKAGPQKLPPHHLQAVSTTSLKTKNVPNHHQGRSQVTKSPIPAVSTTSSTIPSSPPPPPIPSTTPSISKPSSSSNWRGPRTPLSSDPPPSPCSKCGSWSKYHSSSLCKQQRLGNCTGFATGTWVGRGLMAGKLAQIWT